MANIVVYLDNPVYHGQNITFRSPADCSKVKNLLTYYSEDGFEVSKAFQLTDAHGNNVGGSDLFSANVLVKVILDTELGRAYVQNSDTNSYLEGRFDDKAEKNHSHRHAKNGEDPVTPESIDAISSTEKGVANGVATLGEDGKIPNSQISDVISAISDMMTRLMRLEDSLYNDITGNPHSISFYNLDGLIVTGVWNQSAARLEC